MAVLGLFVGIILFNAVSNVLDDTTYWKIFYARDLGLLMDAGITGRGNLELNYNFLSSKKPLGFRLIASANPRIEVYDYNPNIKEPLVASFRFARANNIPVIDNDVLPTFFNIYISL